MVGRGAGTGLSGGAIPRAGGIMIAFARMNRILEIDLETSVRYGRTGRREPRRHAGGAGSKYFYAPDPSSQRACTIGGNVAENAGGPHTLAYGVTTNHVLGLEAVLPDGRSSKPAGKSPICPATILPACLPGLRARWRSSPKSSCALMRQPEAGQDFARHLRLDG